MKLFNFFLLIFVFFSFSKSSYSEKISIVYTVDNTPITSEEIRNEISYLKIINKDLNKMSDESLVVYASKSILKETIKELEIKKYFKFGINDEIVSQNLDRFRASLGLNNIEGLDILLLDLNLKTEFIKKKIEIELLWNQLIFEKYKDKLSIDENKIRNDLKIKIKNEKNEIDEYNLSEILFTPLSKKKEKEELKKITDSINEVGFENTAIIYSSSKTSSSGGNIGWVRKTQLSEKIVEIIQNLSIGEISEPINTPAGKLILILKNKRKKKNEIDFEEELNKAITNEKNKQLNQFSIIYFKKVELDTVINEK